MDDMSQNPPIVSSINTVTGKTAEKENRAFEALVADEEDLEGMIAYSIYKKDKIDWIHRARQSVDELITDEYLEKHFYPHHLADVKLQSYLRQAREMLDISFDREVQSEVAEIVDDIRTELIGTYLTDQTNIMATQISEDVSSTLSKLHKSRRRGIIDGVIASVFAAVLLFLGQQASMYYSKNQELANQSVADTQK